MTPPSRRTVLLDTVVGIAAYGVGLAAVVVLDGVLPNTAALLVGVLVVVVAYTVLFFAVLERMPVFLGRRPWRYSLPNAIAIAAAIAIGSLGLDVSTMFAIAGTLLIAGQTVSQLSWSEAARGDAARIPA